MRFMLLNTCGASVESGGVVALADEAGVVAARALPGRGTSEALMPAVRMLFAEAGWLPAELNGVGVVNGPGSFTGVRVGLSAAKGLCEALGVSMVAMSRLGLLAASRQGSGGSVVAVLDAGRGDFFYGSYQGAAMMERMAHETDMRRLLEGRAGVTCEARVAERLGIGLVEEPGAEVMLDEVRRRVAAGEWSDVAAVDANYLRRTDAEVALEKRNDAHRTNQSG